MNLQVVGGSIKLELVNDGLTELKGEIAGPSDTPYEGGTFVLEIKVPETYPFNPPKVNILVSEFVERIAILQEKCKRHRDTRSKNLSVTMTHASLLLAVRRGLVIYKISTKSSHENVIKIFQINQ